MLSYNIEHFPCRSFVSVFGKFCLTLNLNMNMNTIQMVFTEWQKAHKCLNRDNFCVGNINEKKKREENIRKFQANNHNLVKQQVLSTLNYLFMLSHTTSDKQVQQQDMFVSIAFIKKTTSCYPILDPRIYLVHPVSRSGYPTGI